MPIRCSAQGSNASDGGRGGWWRRVARWLRFVVDATSQKYVGRTIALQGRRGERNDANRVGRDRRRCRRHRRRQRRHLLKVCTWRRLASARCPLAADAPAHAGQHRRATRAWLRVGRSARRRLGRAASARAWRVPATVGRVQAVAAQHKAPCQSDSASAHVCVSAKSCMTSASLSARRQTVSSSYARKFPAVCMSVSKASAISDLGPKSAVALSAAAIDEFHQSFSLDLRQHESGGPGCQLTAHKVFVRESVLWGHGSNTVGQGRTCRRGGVRTASPGAHRRGTAGRPTRYSTSIERARSVGACACARREREGKGWGNTLKGSLLTAEELIVTARCRHSTPSP